MWDVLFFLFRVLSFISHNFLWLTPVVASFIYLVLYFLFLHKVSRIVNVIISGIIYTVLFVLAYLLSEWWTDPNTPSLVKQALSEEYIWFWVGVWAISVIPTWLLLFWGNLKK